MESHLPSASFCDILFAASVSGAAAKSMQIDSYGRVHLNLPCQHLLLLTDGKRLA